MDDLKKTKEELIREIKRLRKKNEELEFLQEGNKGTVEELFRKKAELEALLNGTKAVLEQKDFEETSRAIFDYCKDLIGATSGYVALLNENLGENEVLFLEAGGLPCTVDPDLPMPVRGLRADAYATGRVVYDNNFLSSQWIKYLPPGHVEMKNVMFAPLKVEGKVAGVIGLANKPSDFNENDAFMASAFGELAAIALKNSLTLEELKKSEASHRETSELLNSVLNSITHPFYVIDPFDFTIKFANSASGQDNLPRDMTCYGLIYNRTEPCTDNYNCPLEEVKKIKKPVVLEHIHYTVSNKKNVEVHCYPVFSHGKLTQVIHYALDITERKKAEEELIKYRNHLEELVEERTGELKTVNEKLREEIAERKKIEVEIRKSEKRNRALVEAIPDLMFHINRDGIYLDFRIRDDVELLMPREQIIGSSLSETPFPPGVSEKVLNSIHLALDTGVIQQIEFSIPIKDELREYEARIVKCGQHEVFAIIRNITDRRQGEKKIKKALEEKEVLLREIHHRVKNNLQIISSLLRLQAGHIKEESISAMFEESHSRIKAMALIHEILYQTRDFSKIDFSEYIPRLTDYLVRLYGTKSILNIEVRKVFLDIDRAIPCGLIINELVSNSLKHAFPGNKKGEILLDFRHIDGKFILKISDNGRGLRQDFDFPNTDSLGLQLVSGLVEQLDGTLELNKAEGTEFLIVF